MRFVLTLLGVLLTPERVFVVLSLGGDRVEVDLVVEVVVVVVDGGNNWTFTQYYVILYSAKGFRYFL